MADAVRLQPPVVKPLVAVWDEAYEAAGLRCRATLWVGQAGGDTRPLTALLDTGASYSVVPLALARLLRLDVPADATEVRRPFQTATGPVTASVRPARWRVWWTPEQTGYPFDWLVLLWRDMPPDTSPILGLGGVVNRVLLQPPYRDAAGVGAFEAGRLRVVPNCRWELSGAPAAGCPFGRLTLTDIRQV